MTRDPRVSRQLVFVFVFVFVVLSHGSGRIGSGREVLKVSRVVSGRLYPTRPDPRGLTQPVNSPEKNATLGGNTMSVYIQK